MPEIVCVREHLVWMDVGGNPRSESVRPGILVADRTVCLTMPGRTAEEAALQHYAACEHVAPWIRSWAKTRLA